MPPAKAISERRNKLWLCFQAIIFQFSIIILISCIGEIIKALVPLPIPASIYGLVIMFICLCTGIIKLEKVEAVSDFLLEIMPLAFIPGGVGLITAWAELKGMLVSALVIIVVTSRIGIENK